MARFSGNVFMFLILGRLDEEIKMMMMCNGDKRQEIWVVSPIKMATAALALAWNSGSGRECMDFYFSKKKFKKSFLPSIKEFWLIILKVIMTCHLYIWCWYDMSLCKEEWPTHMVRGVQKIHFNCVWKFSWQIIK